MSLYLGLMSGTSLDGVDAAVARFGGGSERPAPAELVHHRTEPYPDAFRDRLSRAVRGADPEELCRLNVELGRRLAEAAERALEGASLAPDELTAVGSHGQTVWHCPPTGDAPGATLQVGEPAVVAETLGVDVVADFRVRDVAAGGHGAPLTPYFDRLLLSHPDRTRAVQNLGGMGNVTLLPPAGRGEAADPVAFDTGPGVALVDAAAEILSGGALRMDLGGRHAARGTPLEGPLEEWLDDPFFEADPPKSTGREAFGRERARAWLERHRDERPADLLATLTELTARSVARGLEAAPGPVDEVLLCGGGAENPELVRRIRTAVERASSGSGPSLAPLEEAGWAGEAREAAAFALLARQHLLGIDVDVSWATGSAGPRRLGKATPA